MKQNFQDTAYSEGNVYLPGAAMLTPNKGPAEESPQQPDIQHTDDTATPEAFFTATPGYMSHLETPGRLNTDSEYGRTLQEQKLLVAKEVELNWSGRGQHVEFKENEHIPLEVEKTIGYSATALIESVRCRRMRLARKSIPCKRRASLKDLVPEVSYLHRFRHPHIIQMVGTYLQKNTFSMLLYPVATGDLAKFLDEWSPTDFVLANSPSTRAQEDLSRFFFCLTHALRYVHSQGIRHMDIKPSNILVHERRTLGRPTVRSVYLTDFGISRAFIKEDGSQTEGPSSMTKRWCSPEVAAQQPRGRASDIFSLGCVFLDMYTVHVRESLAEFETFRAQGGDSDAFHLTLPQVHQWIQKLRKKVGPEDKDDEILRWHPLPSPILLLDLLGDMIAEDPQKRPTSVETATRLESMSIGTTTGEIISKPSCWGCCSLTPEMYRVAEEYEIHEAFKFSYKIA